MHLPVLCLAVQVRISPQTGHEELIVLAGYCNNVLATMNLHRLDLTTWEWTRESGLVTNPGPGDALGLPNPRQRAAAERVGDTWLLLLGGSPTQVWALKLLWQVFITTDRSEDPMVQSMVHPMAHPMAHPVAHPVECFTALFWCPARAHQQLMKHC